MSWFTNTVTKLVTSRLSPTSRFIGGLTMSVLPFVNEYRSLRNQKHSKLYSIGKTSFDTFIMGTMPMQIIGAGQFAATLAFRDINKHIARNAKAAQSFGKGSFNDNGGDSRAALYQSAVAAQTSTRMSGHSWAGNEAAIFHKRYS